MPVEMVPAVPGGAAAVVVGSIWAVRGNAGHRAVYDALPAHQKAAFDAALTAAATRTIAEIQAIAAPTAAEIAAAAAAAAAAVAAAAAAAAAAEAAAVAAAGAVAIPACARDTAANFRAWMVGIAAAVAAHPGRIKWELEGARSLPHGNVRARTIRVSRNGAMMADTGFVLHYHPDSAGAGVGHGMGSKYHFKPGDAAAYNVCRLYEHDMTDDMKALRDRAKIGL